MDWGAFCTTSRPGQGKECPVLLCHGQRVDGFHGATGEDLMTFVCHVGLFEQGQGQGQGWGLIWSCMVSGFGGGFIAQIWGIALDSKYMHDLGLL